MKAKMILPALIEARNLPKHRIKYSLFPPLGLATLAGYLDEADEVTIQDEHVERLDLDDEPDLVAIEVYVTSAYRAYEIADHYRAKGVHICLGGLHVTSLPDEAALHADTIFIGPGEDTWPAFLADFRAGHPGKLYISHTRTLDGLPKIRRDLIKSQLYLAPGSIVVSRGCPHHCEFCYKEAFFKGGKSFYTRRVDDALEEVATLPGRHMHFLDDNIFGDREFAMALFNGMRGMGKLWQAAGTVEAVLSPGLLECAADSGLRSLFVGFETLSQANLRDQGKLHNLDRDYGTAIKRLHDLGVMVNASFVFGLDDDDESVFDRTVEWAVGQGIETATFHILTPYPGTALYERMTAEGRITTSNWDLYDTRHVVFRPAKMTPEALESGYHRAYRQFYSWRSIFESALVKATLPERLRHVAMTAAWKKADPIWNTAIRFKQVRRFIPALESVLDGFGGLGEKAKQERPANIPGAQPFVPQSRGSR